MVRPGRARNPDLRAGRGQLHQFERLPHGTGSAGRRRCGHTVGRDNPAQHQVAHRTSETGIPGKPGVGLGRFRLPQLLLRRLDRAHHRRDALGVAIDPDAQVDFPLARVGLEHLHQHQDLVGRLRREIVQHRSTPQLRPLRSPYMPHSDQGPVVDRVAVVADPFQRQVDDCRRDPRAAARYHRLRQVDARRLEHRLQSGRGLHGSVIVQKRPVVDVLRPRDVAGPEAGAGLRFVAAEAAGGAGVQYLVVAQLRSGGHLRHVAHQMVLEAYGDVPVAHRRREVFDRAPFRLPLCKAAVQNRDIGLPHQPEQPPDTGGGEQAGAVVDDNLVPVAHPHRPHPADKFLGRRRHVRQGRTGVTDLVDVEVAGAGNVGGGVFGAAVAAHVRQVPGGVEDPEVGIGQVGGEPAGRDKGFRIVRCHRGAPLRDWRLPSAGARRGQGAFGRCPHGDAGLWH